ncbi:FtsW/RodA/SpoVE family cell cycle protein [Gimesia aquarii]|uniref:Probable peptidoglycan glycosyltransferase FtsW n=1 Tax=Gimesia aquarii TaxID=2527964 RepID=A0A517WV99_9PLAN|nr:putative peptidoglycan glycosyltransferase FtsW [Gimesia aquarii]QDU09187.1 Peptidoglycan glycosyltransferase FtsW [Gimesia aquarii]
MKSASLLSNPEHDRSLFISMACALLGLGVLMVHSASITSWPTEFEQVYLSKHLTFLTIAAIVASVASYLPARFWYDRAPLLFWVTVVLLALVLVPGIGTRVNGAQRWLRFGPISLQPSELAKIALPLLTVRLMVQRRTVLKHWIKGTVFLLVPLAIVIPLVLKQPDLGTSLFLVGGVTIALFLGGWPLRNFVVGGLCAIPVLGVLVALRPYQLKRISGFLDTWTNWQSAPYQVKQSLMALGTGGVTGSGLGKGAQKLSFLPEANTDFVFSVAGEELGLIGTLGIVGLWLGLFLAGYNILRSQNQKSFAYVVGFTLLLQLVLQAIINVSVVTAMVPPKGISHPLISYGGTNLMVSLLSLGIIVSLTRSAGEDELLIDTDSEDEDRSLSEEAAISELATISPIYEAEESEDEESEDEESEDEESEDEESEDEESEDEESEDEESEDEESEDEEHEDEEYEDEEYEDEESEDEEFEDEEFEDEESEDEEYEDEEYEDEEYEDEESGDEEYEDEEYEDEEEA